jgi:hypothetical protein
MSFRDPPCNSETEAASTLESGPRLIRAEETVKDSVHILRGNADTTILNADNDFVGRSL